MNELEIQRILASATSRRGFLSIAASSSLVMMGCAPARRGDAIVRLGADPFTLGVASGDPAPDGFVLWTRLAPDPLAGGGMPQVAVPVGWEIAADDAFRRIVRQGETMATPELGHSVHVEAEGLEPQRPYWYRFHYASETSPVGRTFTAPALGTSLDELRFAFVSCQNYQAGYYTAYQHLADEDLELIVHLGDYIYEGDISTDSPRQHNSSEIYTVEDYRNRYALYKLDPNLQAAHRAFPFVVTWDDHEVDNNYAGNADQDLSVPGLFLLRRAAAYQVYYETMPLRRSSMPTGPDLTLYRRIRYGNLAQFNVLDTRQYRTDQPCEDGFELNCAGAEAADASMLGTAQENWLFEGLRRSDSTWNVLANQVPLAPIRYVRADGTQGYMMDKWDGYRHPQQRMIENLRTLNVPNPVVLTGDMHVSWVADVTPSVDAQRSAAVGTEFVGTSISSNGDGSDDAHRAEQIVGANDNVHFFSDRRGYVRCTVTPDRWQADYRAVPYVSRPGAPISAAASFVVENGKAGAEAI